MARIIKDGGHTSYTGTAVLLASGFLKGLPPHQHKTMMRTGARSGVFALQRPDCVKPISLIVIAIVGATTIKKGQSS